MIDGHLYKLVFAKATLQPVVDPVSFAGFSNVPNSVISLAAQTAVPQYTDGGFLTR